MGFVKIRQNLPAPRRCPKLPQDSRPRSFDKILSVSQTYCSSKLLSTLMSFVNYMSRQNLELPDFDETQCNETSTYVTSKLKVSKIWPRDRQDFWGRSSHIYDISDETL